MRRALALTLAAAGCGEGMTSPQADAGCVQGDVATRPDGRVTGGHYASRVERFTPGPGAGFGASEMPDIVLGPPRGAGDLMGGTDVVSLGAGGEIVLGFDVDIVDGPGDDLAVFENAFQVPGARERYWEELGEVSVSLDGARWSTFRCDPRGARPHTGCAGWTPVYSNPANAFCATDPFTAGGDAFDLRAVGLARARYVRIRDLSTQGFAETSTGFDLDAVAVLHAAPR